MDYDSTHDETTDAMEVETLLGYKPKSADDLRKMRQDGPTIGVRSCDG